MTISQKHHKWYVIYTKSRQEKKVATLLQENGVQYYLPLIKTLKKWSDRRKWQEMPLFRSYVFVFINDIDYLKVQEVNGVVGFVKFQGKRTPIPNQQIEAVKIYLNENDRIPISENDYKIGRGIEIISGSMKGISGTLIKVAGKKRVLIEIETIGKQLIINVPKLKLRLIEN